MNGTIARSLDARTLFFLCLPLAFAIADFLLARRDQRNAYRWPSTLAALGCGALAFLVQWAVLPHFLRAYQTLYSRAPAFLAHPLSALPTPLVWITALLAYSFVAYWMHRWEHHSVFLWKFHRVHHQATEYNALLAFRDSAFVVLVEGPSVLVLAAMGFPVEITASVLAVIAAYSLLLHNANFDVVIPGCRFLASPRMHRVHHEPGEGSRCNYGTSLSVWDNCFGTLDEREPSDGSGTAIPFSSANAIWANLEPWTVGGFQRWRRRAAK